MMRARDKKKKATEKKINKARDRGRSDAEARLVLSVALSGSLLEYNRTLQTTTHFGGALVPGAGSRWRRRHRLRFSPWILSPWLPY